MTVVAKFTLVVGENYQVAIKVAADFSGPLEARVIGEFVLEMVGKWLVVGKVVDQFTLVVCEQYQVAVKVLMEFSGPVVAGVIGKCILKMVVTWEVVVEKVVG